MRFFRFEKKRKIVFPDALYHEGCESDASREKQEKFSDVDPAVATPERIQDDSRAARDRNRGVVGDETVGCQDRGVALQNRGVPRNRGVSPKPWGHKTVGSDVHQGGTTRAANLTRRVRNRKVIGRRPCSCDT